MKLPGAGVLEQSLPALPIERLPDLPIVSQVKSAYAEPSTRLPALLGVYSVGALGISNTKLIKSKKARKLVNTLGRVSGVAAIALYLAEQMNGDEAVEVDPVSGLGFLGRTRTGPTRISQPAFAARAIAAQQSGRSAPRYRLARGRRGAGVPAGASDPVVVIKRIRRVIREGGYGDAANYSYAGYGAYGETLQERLRGMFSTGQSAGQRLRDTFSAGQRRRVQRRRRRRLRRRARVGGALSFLRGQRTAGVAARARRRMLRRRRRPAMRLRFRRAPSFPIENRVAPSMALETQTTPSYMIEDQVDPSATIQQAEDAVASEFDNGAEFDDGAGVPMGALVLGGAALVGVALLLRNRKGKRKGKR